MAPEFLADLRLRPEPARVELIRNELNLGFAVGCNQGWWLREIFWGSLVMIPWSRMVGSKG